MLHLNKAIYVANSVTLNPKALYGPSSLIPLIQVREYNGLQCARLNHKVYL